MAGIRGALPHLPAEPTPPGYRTFNRAYDMETRPHVNT